MANKETLAQQEMALLTAEEVEENTPTSFQGPAVQRTGKHVHKRTTRILLTKEFIRKDGTIFPISIRVWLIKNAQGQPVGTWAIVRDITERKRAEAELEKHCEHLAEPVEERTAELNRTIEALETEITERKRAEEALRESELFAQATVDALSAHLAILDENSNIIAVNHAWRVFARANSAETAPLSEGANYLSVCDAAHGPDSEEAAAFAAGIRSVLHGGQDEFTLEYPCHSPNEKRWFIGRVTRFPGKGALRLVIAHENITERKRTEEELGLTLTELERSNKELEQFAYVASHDLQEPLRMISSYMQLLARRYQGKLGTDADEFIAYAVDGASRMQRLINDMLTYSRVGTRGKEFQPTDCTVVLDQTLANNLKAAIEQSGALVTHDPLPTVMADNLLLAQLFQNLIGNAIKFHGAEPPRVHVSAEQEGSAWVFAVRDNGIGIDPKYAERIFVIFQRLHTREEYPGTGIGLAICKKIVERHGGRIWMESQPGMGTTFFFTIPMGGNGL